MSIIKNAVKVETSNIEYKYYYDYKVFPSGKILSPKGKELKIICVNNSKRKVILVFEGKKHVIDVPKLVYELFNPEGEKVSPTQCVELIEENCKNKFSYKNLKVIERIKRIPKDEHFERKFTDEQVIAIQKEYLGRGKRQKGNKKYTNQYHRECLSYNQLAKKYECSLTTITKIIQGRYCVPKKEAMTC